MRIEQIKLSPKKGGNGYSSSFSVSIAASEATACNLTEGLVIKIIDEIAQTIILKRKQYTLTSEIIEKVIALKTAANEEYKSNTNPGSYSYKNMVDDFLEQITNPKDRPAQNAFEAYLFSLPIETLGDLVLLMYMGRDYSANMSIEPGEKRFLDYYETYSYIILGKEQEVLVSILDEKTPLPRYLATGAELLFAPTDEEYSD